MANIVIRGGSVVSASSPDLVRVEVADVFIEGQIITRVGNRGQTSPGFEPEVILDGTDRAVIPGLVNCHTHAAMSLLRGYADDLPLAEWLRDHIWPVEDHLTADDVYTGTLLAAAEMIRSGTTTFADMYFYMDRAAEAVAASGMRARLCRGLIGITPGADDRLEESVEWASRWDGAASGRITADLGPHALYTCPPQFLSRVIDAAANNGLRLHTHISETRPEVNDCLREHGVSPVRVYHDLGAFSVPTLVAHAVHLEEGDLELLAVPGVSVAHNPLSNLKLASGIAPVAGMLECGVTVGLGTDGAASTNQLNIFSEMKACALSAKASMRDAAAMGAATVFYLATRGGALTLGLDRAGLVEPGYLADLCLVRLDLPHMVPGHDLVSTLAYSANGSEVSTVICNGAVLMNDGEMATLDMEKLTREAGEAATNLVSRSQ